MQITLSLIRFLDWFVPEELRLNPVEALRARIIVGLALLIGVLLILAGQFQDHQLEPDTTRGKIQYVAIAALFIGPLLLRFTGSLFALVLAIALIETIVLMLYTQLTGGLSSSGLFWYPIIPVVSLLYLRPQWGFLFLGLFVAHVIYLAALEGGIPTTYGPRAAMIGAIVPSTLLVLVAVVYVWLEKKARIEKDNSESKYQHLMQSPLQGLLVFRGKKIVLANEAALELFDCDSTAQLDKHLLYDLLEVANDPQRMEKSIQRANGSVLRLDVLSSTIDWDGTPVTQVLLRDVTREYQSKIELEALNKELEVRIKARTRDIETNLVQLDLASRVARLSYWEWHIDEASIHFSAGMAAILNAPPGDESLSVDAFLQLVHDEDRALVVDEAANVVMSGASFDVEFRIIIEGTEEHWVHARGEAVDILEGNHPSRIAGSLQNVTDRRLEEWQNIEAQKRDSLGAIAAGLAHDFNNILTPILAYAELIKQTSTNSDTDKFANVISSAGERASTLVHQILSYAREAPGEKRVVNLLEMVHETLNLLEPSLPKNVRLRSSLKDLPTIWANPAQFHSILMNLCVNARDAMPEGGDLDVSLGEVIDGERHLAEIKVSDTGRGIDPENRSKIFEPYFTTKTSTRGTGLGLAIVDGVIREMGGTISVDSTLGKGTTVTFLVPMQELSEDLALQEFRHHPREQQLKVLVVDDDLDVLDVMQIGLNNMGHEVVGFNSSREASNYLLHHRDFDLLVVDKDMPEISGPDLVTQITEVDPSLKLIMVSGRFDDDNAASLGVHATLDKPFTLSKLAEVVNQVAGPGTAEVSASS